MSAGKIKVPRGWRWLKTGEVFRYKDRYFRFTNRWVSISREFRGAQNNFLHTYIRRKARRAQSAGEGK